MLTRIITAAIVSCALGATASAETGKASVYGDKDGHAWTCVAEQKPTGGCQIMNPGQMAAALSRA